MKNFKDFAEENVFDGNKIKIDDILEKEIVILGYRLTDGKYDGKRCLTIRFELEGKTRILFTGSKVLTDQLEKYKDEIPFITKIVKIKKFYIFS